MQSALLSAEERLRELETGIGVIQATLRRTMNERDAARGELEAMTVAAVGGNEVARPDAAVRNDLSSTVDFLSEALDETAKERDQRIAESEAARDEVEEIAYEKRLMEERHDEIFARLEEAVTVSMAPLDKMFSAAGMDPDDLLSQVRRGYSGQGGPLGPLLPALPDEALADPFVGRAEDILEGLDRMNLYRIAAEKVPFALPLKTSFRFTSGFGRRWGRLHAGTDFAGAYGAPIHATADGVVTHAGWLSGYGRLVKIQHEFGIETRYAHMSEVHVQVGQRVSRGDHIGDMGNSGNSTGTHLHYEVRVGGNPINPMVYIKAANDVF
jgi:murein DD-endopeptidase MepM/ murein hydrolase activator NlpD